MNLSSLAASAEELWIPVESNPFYGNGGGGGGLVYARLSALVKLICFSLPPLPSFCTHLGLVLRLRACGLACPVTQLSSPQAFVKRAPSGNRLLFPLILNVHIPLKYLLLTTKGNYRAVLKVYSK